MKPALVFTETANFAKGVPHTNHEDAVRSTTLISTETYTKQNVIAIRSAFSVTVAERSI
jgi:hypothetical protein